MYTYIYIYVHVVALKYYRNNLIPEKYKTVQSCKLNFFCSPFMQLHFSTSERKCFANMPGSHFVKVFSALVSHS